MKGVCLQNLEKFSQAIECYDQALAIDEFHVNSHNFKGISLNSLAKVNITFLIDNNRI